LRTHRALDKDAPESRPVQPPELGIVTEIPEVGGLHHLRAASRLKRHPPKTIPHLPCASSPWGWTIEPHGVIGVSEVVTICDQLAIAVDGFGSEDNSGD
jgi:hypothetical protein